ncbi:MAG: arginase family protein [Solirubrobacterales bacterium]|nr:arginase family protein [Solirubrobacterales bacterium]HMT06268.1 arginase family protein [Solirubrobacterales bacterium]
MRGPLTLLGVPIDSVGTSGGTELGPRSLRESLGSARLEDAGDTSQQIRGLERDSENGWLAFENIVSMTTEVRERVARLVTEGKTPVLLGGCCTMVPGALAGARDATGEIGLAYFDGHLDLFTGQTSPTGEGADFPVAALLGLAPQAMLEATGETPVVDPARIALIGARDQEELDLIAPFPEGLGIGRIEYRNDLRHADLTSIGKSLEAELTDRGSKFWVHLDVDILDRDTFPATDYLMPDGMSIAELRSVLAPLASSPGLVGVDVTCFNPEKDKDGRCGAALAGLLLETLAS